MIKYVFKDGRPNTLKGGSKADPQRIGEALADIKAKAKGKCNSKTVLDAARDKKNYLNRFFEWSDSIAAEKYRQEQAREIVTCIDIIEPATKNEKARRLPAFINLAEKGGRNIYPVQDVLDSDALQSIALLQAERDLEAYEKRLMVFADICDAIRRARELIKERRERSGRGGEARPSA